MGCPLTPLQAVEKDMSVGSASRAAGGAWEESTRASRADDVAISAAGALVLRTADKSRELRGRAG